MTPSRRYEERERGQREPRCLGRVKTCQNQNSGATLLGDYDSRASSHDDYRIKLSRESDESSHVQTYIRTPINRVYEPVHPPYTDVFVLVLSFLSMTDKENGSTPTTPRVMSNTPSRNGSPLKPISPNKHNAGKLTFLQNDAIDDHFNYIHSSTNEIQQQLISLEVQTKQTALDLGQLCDRSKNNNQNLNKLLQNIAQYSNEVVTEGNATKNDITNILTRLDSLNDNLKENRAVNESLETFIRANEQKLLEENTAVNKLLASFIQENEQKQLEQRAEIQKLVSTVEKQSELIEKWASKDNKVVETSVNEVEDKYNDVNEKYKLLCKAYEEKYESYKQLESKFAQLSTLEDKTDNDRLSKLNQFHKLKMNSIPSSSTSSAKRIASTPLHHHQSNSDNEIDEVLF